jgi:hypothetical protein
MSPVRRRIGFILGALLFTPTIPVPLDPPLTTGGIVP